MWIYIPAKVETLNQDNDDLKCGYLLGSGNDAGYIALKGISGCQSDTGWFIGARHSAYPYFAASAMSGSEVLEEGIFTREYNNDTYCGEPVYHSSNMSYGGSLFKSFTQNAYIIQYEKKEPCYSVDTLSGGTSGDHFWNTGKQDIGMNWYADWGEDARPLPFDATLAGGVDAYRADWGDVIDHYHLQPKLDRWIHDPNEGDQAPAGKYINPDDESEIILGKQTFKIVSPSGRKGEVWIGYRLNRTSNDQAYYSPDNGITKLRHRYNFRNTYGEGWYIGSNNSSSTSDYYTYTNGSSAIDVKSFTAEYYHYNKETSGFQHIASGDLGFELGPYVLETEDYNIKMGEVSLWR